MKKLLALSIFLTTLSIPAFCSVLPPDTTQIIAERNALLTGDSLDVCRMENDSCAKENGELRVSLGECKLAYSDLRDANSYYVEMDKLHMAKEAKLKRTIAGLKTAMKIGLPVAFGVGLYVGISLR